MSEPTVSNYPDALDDDTSLAGNVVNMKSFVLGATVDDITTTITVTTTISGINTPCYLLLDSELVYAANKSGSDFTSCVRGADGTTASAHTSGINVDAVYSANLFNQLKRAIIAIETELGISPKSIDETVAASASPITVSNYLDMIAYQLKAIMGGAAHWYSTPVMTIPGYLYQLTLSNNVADATNDIDISVGQCVDSTNVHHIILASALTKRLDAAWAVGTNQGGLDTGSIANATYFVWLIKRSDTGVVDALFSTSASAPTMPANYDYKRRIGSIIRSSGAILAFVQDGDLFMLKAPIRDINATNPGTSAVTRTLTVPVGIRVKALIQVAASGPLQTDLPGNVYISDLSLTDVAAGPTTGGSISVYASSAISDLGLAITMSVMTNTSAQVRSRLQLSATNTNLTIRTIGWEDTRGTK